MSIAKKSVVLLFVCYAFNDFVIVGGCCCCGNPKIKAKRFVERNFKNIKRRTEKKIINGVEKDVKTHENIGYDEGRISFSKEEYNDAFANKMNENFTPEDNFLNLMYKKARENISEPDGYNGKESKSTILVFYSKAGSSPENFYNKIFNFSNLNLPNDERIGGEELNAFKDKCFQLKQTIDAEEGRVLNMESTKENFAFWKERENNKDIYKIYFLKKTGPLKNDTTVTYNYKETENGFIMKVDSSAMKKEGGLSLNSILNSPNSNVRVNMCYVCEKNPNTGITYLVCYIQIGIESNGLGKIINYIDKFKDTVIEVSTANIESFLGKPCWDAISKE